MNQKNILKSVFGYDDFRKGQDILVDNILNKRDVVGIMPTGAGKSICFQVPALMMDGITLVISPLISLMKDQVQTLLQLGVKVAYINSSLSPMQITEALRRAKNGAYNIMYIAPERLLTSEFISFAKQVNISMITIDEAHCISQWGQDFRPSYTQIPQFIQSLNSRPVISAFTATATNQVKDDIISILKLDNPKTLTTGFDRENLSFAVDRVKDKKASLLQFLSKQGDKSGIIYCISRKNVEMVCEFLNKKGYDATRYHAGLSDLERHTNQDDFLFDRKKIIVATNAFGMGIDKSNVSYVVHFNMPKDIESYYQEAGRAGRDGNEAEALLLYSPQDVVSNEWLIDNQEREVEDIELLEKLKAQDKERLKQMTFFSTTNDCLREFILKYFGETPKNYCGKCSNCNTKFETIDILANAKDILKCVKDINQRFGVSMIVDILRGSRSAKILNFKFDKIESYGKISKKNQHSVISIVNFLIQNEYLQKSNEQYPVVLIGKRAKELFEEGAILEMKIAEEKVISEKIVAKVALDNIDNDLYQKLKELRKQIADKQGVPAFVVFADKTLIQISEILPKTKSDFLNISGIGEVKYDRYGEQFLEVVNNHVG